MNLGCFVIAICHELGHDVYGYGEDDGAVVLCGYAVQGLQVPQLNKKKTLQICIQSFLPNSMVKKFRNQ